MVNPDLYNALASRQPLPNPKTKVPPPVQRSETANKMQDGYANGWSPNPVLTRMLMSRQSV